MLKDWLVEGNWLPSNRNDPRAYALYIRHYSAKKNKPFRKPGNTNVAGPGIPMVLITADSDALFVWLKNTVERYDKEVGINCSVFRNESAVLSSQLILEAEELAWGKWPGERLFTYVDPVETAKRRSKRSPAGKCFIAAGWRPVLDAEGNALTSEDGKVLLEKLPGWEAPLAA